MKLSFKRARCERRFFLSNLPVPADRRKITKSKFRPKLAIGFLRCWRRNSRGPSKRMGLARGEWGTRATTSAEKYNGLLSFACLCLIVLAYRRRVVDTFLALASKSHHCCGQSILSCWWASDFIHKQFSRTVKRARFDTWVVFVHVFLVVAVGFFYFFLSTSSSSSSYFCCCFIFLRQLPFSYNTNLSMVSLAVCMEK